MRSVMFRGLILLALTGCATTQALTTSGSRVEVVSQAPADQSCSFVAPVSAEWGANAQSYQTNSVNAYNDVRNQAGALGATHLVVTDAEAQESSVWAGDGCRNCVLVQAQAFRCR